MKYRSFFVIAFIILAGCVVFSMNDYVFSEGVHKSRSSFKMYAAWNNLIADSVNEHDIKLWIDGNEVDAHDIYMNYNRDIMVPVSLLVSEFDCSMRLYDESMLVIERNQIKIIIEIGSPYMNINEQKIVLKSEAVMNDGMVYIPMEVINEAFDCKYTWDMEEHTAMVYATLSDDKYPARFDYRDIDKMPVIKNQGKLGTCWSFAALTALESTLLPEERFDFSEDHMSIRNGFSVTQNDGGEYTMSMAYLVAWQGPVYEEDDPYGDGESPENLSAVKHVQEIQILGHKNLEQIKEMVYKYGGVQTSIYTNLKNASSKSSYYNDETYSYCYIGTQKPNHDVVIIGWDDNYPKENFNAELEADGAFICQNSWGEQFGDKGIFYISYYDSNIGIHSVIYTGIEPVDNYDKIYQTDLCGWVGQLGYVNEKAYFANVYTADEREILEAVSFYATDRNTEYEVYYVPQFKNTDSFADMKLVAEGKFENAGYYTVNLKKMPLIEAGERFAVVVKIITPNAERPIAVEYVVDESTEGVIISDGEGYISLSGKRWERTEETQKCNVCLKAFTSKAG